ncbi:MAG: peptidoglycan DD-metalloendopeptidase family protein [Bacillota bacterium]
MEDRRDWMSTFRRCRDLARTSLAKLHMLWLKADIPKHLTPIQYRVTTALQNLRSRIRRTVREAQLSERASVVRRSIATQSGALKGRVYAIWQRMALKERLTPLMGVITPRIKRYTDPTLNFLRRYPVEQRAAAMTAVVMVMIMVSCIVPRPAFAVMVGDENVGVLPDAGLVMSYVQRLIASYGHATEIELQIDPMVTVKPIRWAKGYTVPADLEKIISSKTNIVADASVINIDGKASIPVASTKIANQVLDQVKQAYVDQAPGLQTATGEFQEAVSVEKRLIPLDQIRTPEQAVRLLLDGTERQELITVSRGDSLWSIAGARKTSIEELKKANPTISEDNIKEGQTLKLVVAEPLVNVKTVEVVHEETEIAYGVQTTYTDDLFTWEQEVQRPGVPGRKALVFEVTKINGEEQSRQQIDEKVVAQPVDKIVAKGTKVAPNRGTGAFAWPLRTGYVSSGYGWRDIGYHNGVDIAAPHGTPIYAADSGIVTFAGWDSSGLGYMVTIDHRDGTVSRYGHMSAILVEVEQGVTKGEAIGRVGNTGYSFGAHLHFEVYSNGARVNPMNYFD